VNRLTLKEDGRESSLSFEAQNGFLVADSGGDYRVSNASYDPLRLEDGNRQPRVSPRLVKIERITDDGEKQMKPRDWAKGLFYVWG